MVDFSPSSEQKQLGETAAAGFFSPDAAMNITTDAVQLHTRVRFM